MRYSNIKSGTLLWLLLAPGTSAHAATPLADACISCAFTACINNGSSHNYSAALQLCGETSVCKKCMSENCGICTKTSTSDILEKEMEDDQTCPTLQENIAAAVRAGVRLYRANDLLVHGAPGKFPPTLDKASNGIAGLGNRFFTEALQTGITDIRWSKQSIRYTFTCGKTVTNFQYNPTKGTFLELK